MARKTKPSKSPAPKGPRGIDTADAKIGRINSYQDVPDEEDEFYLQQDEIALQSDPSARRKTNGILDESDEEVIPLEDLPSDEDSNDSDDDEESGNDDVNGEYISSDDDEGKGRAEEDEEYGDWGKSKRAYYDANEIENEEDAALEEAEARKIQQRQLASISAKDFGVDENDWKAPIANDEILSDSGNFTAQVAKKVQIPANTEDQIELLHLLHPEFEPLKDEYLSLAPLQADIERKGLASNDPHSTARRKSIVLTAYLGVLSIYFAIMSQPRPDGQVVEVREHSIMESLVSWRKAWLAVRDLVAEPTPPPEPIDDAVIMDIDDADVQEPSIPPTKMSNGVKSRKHTNGTTDVMQNVGRLSKHKQVKKSTKESRLSTETEARLKDLDNLLPTISRQKPTKSKALVQFKDDDFGEEDFIFEEDAEENAKRKKSLRFYTAQIAQKSNKRDRAGRDAGGDLDVPHRERNKDRQEKLTAEAMKRGLSNPLGADLDDGDYDDNDLTNAKRLKAQVEDDDMSDSLEYYNQVASKLKADKLKKQLIHEAEKEGSRIVEIETVDPETGKRAIGYTIEKNKGLTPHRKKDVRNPRVKKRKKYEQAKKKLGSKKAIYKAPTSAYAGETTGIRTKLVKSVKFK